MVAVARWIQVVALVLEIGSQEGVGDHQRNRQPRHEGPPGSPARRSMESVGQELDGVLKSTADIISQGKKSLLLGLDGESEMLDINKSLSSGRYSRFDVKLNAIQSNVNTFCKDPEDLGEYQKWKWGFTLVEKSNDVEGLIGEIGVLESLYKRLVPSIVDHETFWCRYFYKVKQQESVRANLVKRAISIEELSW